MGYVTPSGVASVYDPADYITSDYFEPKSFIGNIFKIGNAVFISCSAIRPSGIGFPVFSTLFTLAEGLRPKSEAKACGIARSTKSGAKVPAYINITTNGMVILESNNDDMQYDQVVFTASYIV